MECLQRGALDASGAPALMPEEVVLLVQPHVSLYNRDEKTRFQRGIAYITNYRLMWLDEGRKDAPFVAHLKTVARLEDSSGFLLRSPKITVHFLPQTEGMGGSAVHVKLSFKRGGKDEFLRHAAGALARKSWVEVKADPPRPAGFSTTTAGISGLIRQQQSRQTHTKQLAEEAFQDLNSLMDKAKQVVALAERYTAERQRAAAAGSAAGEGGAEAAEGGKEGEGFAEYSSLVHAVGIASPVTRDMAGKLFDHELARQAAHFLAPLIERQGGIMALTDAYCIYNRARGTSLVAPDEMLRACQLFSEIGLPLRLVRFDSGVLVLQSTSANVSALAERLKPLLEAQGSTTAFLLAIEWNLPLVVAQTHLQTLEKAGELCRDESVEGVRFFRNLFADAAFMQRVA